jgi:hypothetical protein
MAVVYLVTKLALHANLLLPMVVLLVLKDMIYKMMALVNLTLIVTQAARLAMDLTLINAQAVMMVIT